MIGESSPPPPETARNQVLYALMQRGWANACNGSTAAPTGRFAKISNSDEKLREVVEAFEDELTSAGLLEPAQLVGHFLVLQDEQGLVGVNEYRQRGVLDHEFQVLSEAYGLWLGGSWS